MWCLGTWLSGGRAAVQVAGSAVQPCQWGVPASRLCDRYISGPKLKPLNGEGVTHRSALTGASAHGPQKAPKRPSTIVIETTLNLKRSQNGLSQCGYDWRANRIADLVVKAHVRIVRLAAMLTCRISWHHEALGEAHDARCFAPRVKARAGAHGFRTHRSTCAAGVALCCDRVWQKL